MSLYVKNIFLLIAGILMRSVLWAKGKQGAAMEGVVVFQGAKLGDMVCTTPLFRAIKKHFPNLHLTVVGDAVNKELLKHNSDVDDYVIYTKNLSEDLWRFKAIKADIALLTGPSPEILGLLCTARIPTIVAPRIRNGFCPQETKAYRFLRMFVRTVPHTMGSYAPREYLRLLEPLGVSEDDTKKHLSFSKEAETVVDALLEKRVEKGEYLVGVAVGTGYALKLWDLKKFATVIEHTLARYNARIFLIGSDVDKNHIEVLLTYLKPNERIINTGGLLSLDELKAFISKLHLFISVDTGPVYIAEAFDVPTIDIVGPMDEREQPPRGEKHIAITARRDKPAIHIMNTSVFDPKEARRQSEDISAASVTHAVDELAHSFFTHAIH